LTQWTQLKTERFNALDGKNQPERSTWRTMAKVSTGPVIGEELRLGDSV
jgi:hypothetical protein